MDAERDPFDELTALFTTEEPLPAPGPSKPLQGSPAFELVGAVDANLEDGESVQADLPAMRVTVAICGHLPVMAGLWVTQYADRVAEASGPTGLVRLEGGRCSLELFRTPSEAARMGHGCSMLDSIEAVAHRVRRWIICVDERDAAETVRAGSDEVVVLTGADKPAVLAAYRLAKAAASKAGPKDELDLGLVVVGASEQRTQAVGGVLRTVAGEFMGRPLEVIDSIQRMDVVESARRMLFNEQDRVTPAEAVELLEELSLECEQPDGLDGGFDAPPAGDVQLRYVQPTEPVEDVDASVDPRPRHGSRPTVRLSPALPSVRMDSRFRDIKVLDIDLQADAGMVEEEVARRRQDSPEEPVVQELPEADQSDGIARHFPELMSLPYRCPLARGIELAKDDQGRLRLLCRDEDLAQARVAASWATANEALIRIATEDLAGGDLPMVIDVVTDDATKVTDLHRTGVRLHLVSPVNGAGDDQWFRAELNTEETARVPG
ncbi:MAG: hypothetical protein MK085_07160 [Phycisphaerales bacterium]|nr:hypothetical protein [Phycisphaerales bacterium]